VINLTVKEDKCHFTLEDNLKETRQITHPKERVINLNILIDLLMKGNLSHGIESLPLRALGLELPHIPLM